MKKLLFSASLLMLGTGVFAQSNMTGSTGRIGVKAGVNLARIHASGPNSGTINDLTKDNVGYNITAFGDFGVGKNFFIQPGISLQNKGTKLESTVAGFTGTNTVNVMTIEVPVNAVLRIPTGTTGAVQISAGPYIGFNIDGQSKLEATSGANQGTTKTDLKFGNDTGDNLTSTDFGANFGLAYRLTNGFQVGANYGLGLTDLQPKANRTNNYKATNRVLGFTVGYSF